MSDKNNNLEVHEETKLVDDSSVSIKKNANGRVISGKVVSIAGTKTATIVVERRVLHPKYRKTVKRFKKYLIHDEKNELCIGDTVMAIECRPLSKTKSFRLQTIVTTGAN